MDFEQLLLHVLDPRRVRNEEWNKTKLPSPQCPKAVPRHAGPRRGLKASIGPPPDQVDQEHAPKVIDHEGDYDSDL